MFAMGGPKTLSRKKSGGVRGRNGETAGAPLQVSADTDPINVDSPKVGRKAGDVDQGRMDLAQRPSTAGVVSSRRPLYKHETRGDMHCAPLASNRFQTTYFDFPLPASILTPAATPKSSPSPTASSRLDLGPYRIPEEIGMALGTPNQNAGVWSPHVHFQASPHRYTPESPEEWVMAPPTKSKSSKWKILGGLFGRKTSGPPTAFYQLQPEEHRPDYHAFPPPSNEHRGRGRTVSERKVEKPKPRIRRANTSPIALRHQESNNRSTIDPRARTSPLPSYPLQTPRIHVEGGSLLDIEIPSTEMERYSVMFGDLIKPSQTSTSSLLARRQATLDKLKVVSEKLAQHDKTGARANGVIPRQRRATSPQPNSSPSMSLFPPPLQPQRDAPTYAPQHPSPLHRSNTSPAALSPNRPVFKTTRRAPSPRPEPPPKTDKREAARAPSAASLRPTATLTSPWSAESSYIASLSPGSMVSQLDDDDEAFEVPLRPDLKEPAWEMITPASRSKFNNIRRTESARSPIKGENRQRDPFPRQPLQSSLDALAQAGATEEADKIIETAASISIARQISVSRQQRQLLVRVRSNAKQKPKAAGEKLIMNDRSMTPKVVNMRSRRAESEQVVFDQATLYRA